MNVVTKIARPEDVGLNSARLAAIPQYFGSYVDRGKLAGLSTLVARRGQIVHFEAIGKRDRELGAPMERDSIFRIYSMSKPITSLALMMLFEEGHFQLNHEVHRYIPEFKKLRVWAGGTNAAWATKEPARPMTIRDLLTHTSGLTYGFMNQHPIDRMYRHAGIGGAATNGMTLKDMVAKLADIPLLFSPGGAWNYSVSTDVCGYLVEVLSGMPLDEFLQARIFGPLGMVDTGFGVPQDKLHRFTANYERNPQTGETRLFDKSDASSTYARPNPFLSGGGGLVSTMTDYWRFCQMCLNGGTFEGTRLVSRKTLEFMRANHLPGGRTMKEMSLSSFGELAAEGAGFGLGFQVILDPAEAQSIGSVGNYSWGGAASTYFWIDPEEELVAILMTQLMPSSTYPLRPQMQQLVYAAIED
ncbi:serine hydrolase domain-containing protein [Parvibaculum sp.]|uniref:serine hydrolase domain-containing protein n=1 Tax=Parvibaculum sp. TaxID=2024848 RepID=UPI002BABFB11|nr:serine hydrolase domain-containing protein [Parvibaculum sp.]HUD52451.1 serine hydrolase domain-containing protein [Parvibaculum sp.]